MCLILTTLIIAGSSKLKAWIKQYHEPSQLSSRVVNVTYQ